MTRIVNPILSLFSSFNIGSSGNYCFFFIFLCRSTGTRLIFFNLHNTIIIGIKLDKEHTRNYLVCSLSNFIPICNWRPVLSSRPTSDIYNGGFFTVTIMVLPTSEKMTPELVFVHLPNFIGPQFIYWIFLDS